MDPSQLISDIGQLLLRATRICIGFMYIVLYVAYLSAVWLIGMLVLCLEKLLTRLTSMRTIELGILQRLSPGLHLVGVNDWHVRIILMSVIALMVFAAIIIKPSLSKVHDPTSRRPWESSLHVRRQSSYTHSVQPSLNDGGAYNVQGHSRLLPSPSHISSLSTTSSRSSPLTLSTISPSSSYARPTPKDPCSFFDSYSPVVYKDYLRGLSESELRKEAATKTTNLAANYASTTVHATHSAATLGLTSAFGAIGATVSGRKIYLNGRKLSAIESELQRRGMEVNAGMKEVIKGLSRGAGPSMLLDAIF